MPEDNEENLTENEETRWKYLNSVLAGVIMLTFLGLLVGGAAGVITLSAISQPWFLLFAAAVTTVLVWSFGKDAYTSFKGE